MTDTWQDIPTSDRPKGHPSTEALEIGKLRASITHALERLNASLFTNAEHQQAKDALRVALQTAPQCDEGKADD